MWYKCLLIYFKWNTDISKNIIVLEETLWTHLTFHVNIAHKFRDTFTAKQHREFLHWQQEFRYPLTKSTVRDMHTITWRDSLVQFLSVIEVREAIPFKKYTLCVKWNGRIIKSKDYLLAVLWYSWDKQWIMFHYKTEYS